MAGPKSQGIPSWQREQSPDATRSQPAASTQNDDPVYAQATAAAISEAKDRPSNSASDISSLANNDDPVYSQAEAEAASASTSTKSEAPQPLPSPSSITVNTSDPELDPHLRSRSSLLASASKFLQDEDLRNASLERKTTYLEGKGLTKDEISELLESQGTASSTSISTSTTTSTTTTSTSPPPIITYPEFLLHAHRPKPLVTRTRIINAVYATGLISGSLYLANRYLFEPMAEQMAMARHELFDTARKGVTTLNERLEQNVSMIPSKRENIGEDGEAPSVASDPDELFHRDIGVQTSPKLEKEPSESSDSVDGGSGTAVERHVSSVSKITEQIKSLSETGKDALEEEEATRSIVGDLQAYLEELAYGGRKPAFSWENGYASESAANKGETKMDEIARFKAEIRSVKGALLSARNFPSGTNVRAR